MPSTPETFNLFDWVGGKIPDVAIYCGLYVNQVDLATGPTLPTFLEPSFEGYAREAVILDRGSIFEAGRSRTAEFFPCVFNRGEFVETPNAMYGFFLIAFFPNGIEQLVLAQDFFTPVNLLPGSKPFGVVIGLMATQETI